MIPSCVSEASEVLSAPNGLLSRTTAPTTWCRACCGGGQALVCLLGGAHAEGLRLRLYRATTLRRPRSTARRGPVVHASLVARVDRQRHRNSRQSQVVLIINLRASDRLASSGVWQAMGRRCPRLRAGEER